VQNWRRRAGVRVQTTAAATLAVALAVAAGSGAFVVFLQRSQLHDIDASLSQQGQTLAAVVAQSGSDDVELPAELGTTSTQQVVGLNGAVLAFSPDLRGHPPLVSSSLPLGATRLSLAYLGRDANYRVLAVGARDSRGSRVTVVVAQSLEPAEASRQEAIVLLLIGGPLLVLLVAVLTWWVAGRALQPVEAMRRQVDDIGAATLDARVSLPSAQDEVWRLGGTLNRMLARLESAVRAQRQFVSDASHELRSPLAVLRTNVEVAMAHPGSTEWLVTAEVLLEEAERVERLVADLLLLANADERGLPMRREDVDLDDLLASEATRLRGTTSLAVTATIAPVRVRGDRDRLARALRNLVENAARHARSTVSLRLYAQGDNALIEISDDGDGVPVEDRERVFQRFVRLDVSRSRQQGGTGLGLAIVRQIVEAHVGTVEFVEGTTVRVVLPQ
jgi:signal transduction histidine kinase